MSKSIIIRSAHTGGLVGITAPAVGLAAFGEDGLAYTGLRRKDGTIHVMNGAFLLRPTSPDSAVVEGPAGTPSYPVRISLLWQGTLPAGVANDDENGYYDAARFIEAELAAGRAGPTTFGDQKTTARIGDLQDAIAALLAAGQAGLAERLAENLPQSVRAAA